MRKIFTIIGFMLFSFSIAACQDLTSITIVFETNGGNTIENVVVDAEDTGFEMPTPVKEGFIFEGWYVNEELTDQFNFATLVIVNEITVYAKWSIEAETYTISFETNGGSTITPITLASGVSITVPTQPTKTGFTFDGWYSDSALTSAYTFTVMPAQNFTLYAKWSAVVVQSTISFNSNGGSLVPSLTQNSGTIVVAPTPPSRTGYTFDGWYSDIAITQIYTFNLMPSENITLYAKWTINTYTLFYYDNDGTVLQETDYDFGADLSGVIPPVAFKEGYTFVEWSWLLPVTMPDMDFNLVALYVINEYTISFEENGGTDVDDITLDYLSDVTDPISPTKPGYTFDGWYSDSTLTTAYVYTTMPLDGITLYAKWTATLYTIAFEENGGSVVLDITQGYLTEVTAPSNPTKIGYTFVGWFSDVELLTTYPFSTMPMNNITVYAKWTVNQYTISFEENGGSTLLDLTEDYLSIVAAPTPIKEGYTFVGWFADELLTLPFVFDTMPAANTTVYAKWEAVLYTITFFDFINGYHTLPALYAASGETISIPTPDAILGYDFLGWYIDVQFQVEFTSTVMPDYQFTLYGLWVESVYTATYNTNGGSLIDAIDFTYFMDVPIPNTPTKDGYLFAGWYSDETLLLLFNFGDPLLSDVTIYCKWIVDEGFDPIQLILLNQPTEQVTLRGVIYYKFPDATNPGFYLYDGSGSIFVSSDVLGFNVGDGVSVIGYFGLVENKPQIESVSSIDADGSFVIMPGTEAMILDDLIQLSPNDTNIYGRLVEITAVVGNDKEHYYLTTLTADEIVYIERKSYLPLSNPFVDLVGQKITIKALMHKYDSVNDQWEIIYDDEQAIVEASMTDQEKLEELVLFIQTMFDNQSFYNGQYFKLPQNDEVYGTLISVETFGIHASLYEPLNGVFGTATEEVEIGVRITVTMDTLSLSGDLTFILKPMDSITVAEFIAAEEMTYHQVSGVVIFAATLDDMQMMVVSDITGTLTVMSNSEVSIGDYVIVAGYRMAQSGLATMANQDPSLSLIEIIDHDYPFPLVPVTINVVQFLEFDANNTLYWLQYFEIIGRLRYDDVMASFFIENEQLILPILALNQEIIELLNSYEGFIVSITGISLPNLNEKTPTLMFAFLGRPEDIGVSYTDEVLIDEIFSIIDDKLSTPTYYPGQFLELTTDYPLMTILIDYEAFGVNAGLIDISTGQISPAIETELWIDLHVTITVGLSSETFDIQLHVAPVVVLSVSEFYGLTDYDFPYYVSGVVIFYDSKENMYIIADDTRVIFFTNSTLLEVGDLVVVYGHKMLNGELTMLVGDLSEITSHDHLNPLIRSTITMSDFVLLDSTLPENKLKYFQIAGVLIEDQKSGTIFLSDGEFQIRLLPANNTTYQSLISFIGQEVLISGLTMPNLINPEEGSTIVFIDYPGDIILDATPD